MSLISAIFLSLAAGVITAIPGLLSELGKREPKNIPLLIDVRTFWGHQLTRGEVFLFGFFIHLLMAALFGALYELIAVKSFVRPYHLDNLMLYATFFWVFVGGVIFPIVGLGLFGKKRASGFGSNFWSFIIFLQFLFGLVFTCGPF